MLVYRAQNDDNDGNESNGNDVGCGDDELIAQPSTPNDECVNDEVMYEGEGNEVDGGDENEEGDDDATKKHKHTQALLRRYLTNLRICVNIRQVYKRRNEAQHKFYFLKNHEISYY